MTKRLMILEVSQKQAYIFASKRLAENAARSADIAYVTGSRFFAEAAGSLYREADNLVYAGGGHTVLQFDSREEATMFARAVTCSAMEQFPGMELFVKQIDYDEGKTPGENLGELSAALERKKALRLASFRRVSFGVEQAGKKAASVRRGCETLAAPAGWRFPTRFDEIAGEDNFIAVVHIDGNGMGKRVEQIYQKCRGWEECRQTLQRFSEGIQRDFEQAFRETVDAVLQARHCEGDSLPIRPVVLAGDDVCFVTAGSIGLECARIFLEKLCVKENCEQPGLPYAACAGVALVHTKYPFHQAYDLAEELCSSAKRFGAQIDAGGCVSAMDWHIEFGQLRGGLSAQRADYVTEDGCRMELRPVAVIVPERVDDAQAKKVIGGVRSYGFFKEMNRVLAGDVGNTARSKIKELRNAIKQGRTATEYFLHTQSIEDLRFHSFSARYRQADEQQEQFRKAIAGVGLRKNVFEEIDGVTRCLFFDALEMIDHFEAVGEART